MISDWTVMDYVILVASYLFGSIPFGVVVTRLVTGKDVRKEGSGNIGATNVWRIAGRTLGLLTFILDSAKGVVAVLVARQLGSVPEIAYIAGALSVTGHVAPVWLKFRGGKGVATTMAVFWAIAPMVGGVASAVWVGVFSLTRISSLSSLVAMASAVITSSIVFQWDKLLSPFSLTIYLAFLVSVRHYSNICRLLARTESRFK